MGRGHGAANFFQPAIDVVGVGDGQLVLVVQGSSARMTDQTKNMPADAVIVGIVDSVDLAGAATGSRGRKKRPC